MKILLKILTSLLSVPVFTGASSSFFSSINSPFIRCGRALADFCLCYFPAFVFFLSGSNTKPNITTPIATITSKTVISPGRSITLVPVIMAIAKNPHATRMIIVRIFLPPCVMSHWIEISADHLSSSSHDPGLFSIWNVSSSGRKEYHPNLWIAAL
jgi:hypothetical protein